MHSHAGVNREVGVTSLDGSHTHTFRLPDGTVVTTSEDGGHAHNIERGLEPTHVHGGIHAHTVVINGETVRTEVDGWHNHQVGESKVAEGGMHSHALVLPTGETIISHYAGQNDAVAAAKRKKGSERKREAPTAKRLETVEASAIAVLKSIREPSKPSKPSKPPVAKKSRLDCDDLSPPRTSVIPKYDPTTKRITR